MWIKTLGTNEIINTNCISIIFVKDNYIEGIIDNIGTFDLFKYANKQEAKDGLKKLLNDLNNEKYWNFSSINFNDFKYPDPSCIHWDEFENYNLEYDSLVMKVVKKLKDAYELKVE